MEQISLSKDLQYLVIFSLVLLLPKILMRFKVPTGISAFAIGAIAAYMYPQIHSDQLVRFLAQIGITSLFVFAGMEVNFEELKEERKYLTGYIIKSLIFIGLASVGLNYYFDLSAQNSLLLALGILTPSAGFIINSLHSFKIGEDQEYWVKSKAISKEVISVILLFIALQANDLKSLGLSFVFFAIMFMILPIIFRLFFKFIAPLAPNMEVPFLVAISLIAGVISKELGAYYIVGAFIVGLVGSSFKKQIFKNDEEHILKSLSSFFIVFLPFYFFYAGANLSIDQFTQKAVTIGSVLCLVFVPLRFVLNSTSIKLLLKDFTKRPYKISLSLIPTLIFGLVIAGILQERADFPQEIAYALIFYTIATSLLPTILFPLQKRTKDEVQKVPNHKLST